MSDTHAPTIDLEQYSPAYFTFIANKLARGASATAASAWVGLRRRGGLRVSAMRTS